MQYICGQVAKALEHQIHLDVQKRGVELSAERVKSQLSETFAMVLGKVDSDMKMR
jgi:hypothetical protein